MRVLAYKDPGLPCREIVERRTRFFLFVRKARQQKGLRPLKNGELSTKIGEIPTNIVLIVIYVVKHIRN